MATEQPDVRAVFCEALDQKSPEDLARFLDVACHGNTAFRQDIEALLKAHGEAGRFLRGSTSNTGASIATGGSTETAGTMIGPYKLLEQIGEGGFGIVFMAEQLQRVFQTCAKTR